MINRVGATRLGVWIIKHLVSPAQRWLYRRMGGKGFSSRISGNPVLLLTTKGRRSGIERTTPVFYLRDGSRLVICNVNPGFERTNPWVLNLRANPLARVQLGDEISELRAREATEAEISQYWPKLLRIWPAYGSHYEKSRQRTVFILEGV